MKENIMNQEQKKNTKIINVVVNVFLVVAILFGAICAFTAFVSKDATGVPSIFGIRIFVIQSNSMHPTFDEGDVVVSVKVKDASKLNPSTTIEAQDGDIITFETVIQAQAVLNTHRIVDKEFVETADGGYWEFTTRGDNVETNTRNDSMKVREKSIVGKYLFRIKGLGKFIEFLQSGLGFFLVIVLPVMVFFIWQLVQFFRAFFAFKTEKMRLEFEEKFKSEAAAKIAAESTQDSKEEEQPSEEEKE